ncbi:MAG: hypothetical protein EZS28_025256 [Streblomastix strix]|uniref:Uncharacterized protein n=1 Tax=Streblomastix strix TaxID=222440 RepID=A0A5J4V9I9_9EUKA|nr:MAG: hypothetical protein EZS28_025256 [Streblomastix strix]
MFIQLLITLLSLTFAQHAQIQNSENADIIYLLFVNATSLRSRDCGTYGDPCRQIDDVIRLLESIVQGKQYPTVDIVAEGNTQMNLIGQQFPIGQIIVSYSKFIIDIGNKYFLIDDDGSSLKFSNCTMLRNAGNSALNAYSLAVVNYGSLILEKLNINGNSLEGNLPMIQATQPKLIQITSLTLANLKLGSGNAQPLLLSVTELTNGSNIIIKYLSMIQNTAGTQAETGIIFVNKKDQSGSSTQTILSIENSEIVHNSLAPITEACAVQIQGLKPQQILIKNSTIENISPPNNNKQYEFKIILPSGSVSQNLIDQFQTVEFGVTLNPVAAKTLPNKHFDYLELPLSKEYADIRVDSNGLEECTSYIANYYQDVKSVGCAVIIIRAQETQEQLKGIPRSVSIVGTFTENDLRTDVHYFMFTMVDLQHSLGCTYRDLIYQDLRMHQLH